MGKIWNLEWFLSSLAHEIFVCDVYCGVVKGKERKGNADYFYLLGEMRNCIVSC
jgi:hypothetical protein